MKRAVICANNPQDYINQLDDYSIMIINPDSAASRQKYLLDNADYSLLITNQGESYRDGADYCNERLFWYTSGTTGDSKFCSFTQDQVNTMAQRICSAYDITANDRYVSIMPLWHAHGQGMYWAMQQAQCEIHYVPVKNIKSIPDYDPTFISAIPDFLRVISQMDFNHLRFVRSASAALPTELYQHLSQKYQVPVIEAFGMTEALSQCFTNPLHGEQRPGTVGLPDGIEADIVNGHLYIQGSTVFATGWYDTGDLADRDKAGYYRILGRSKDQINVRGIKVNPVSLEYQLKSNIDNLTDCVIFGTNFVKCLYTGTCDSQTIKNFLIGLGQHCWPRVLEQIDSIPVSPSGKISRIWLNGRY